MNAQVKALLVDTLKKELRNKTLYFALIFSTISIFIGYSIAKLFVQNGVSSNDMSSALGINLMFRYLNVWGVIISVFFGVGAVRSDFHNNVIYQYLTFPISRTTYFLTRLVGTWIMVFAFYLYSYIFTYILFYSIYKNLTPTVGQLGNIIVMGLYTFSYVGLTFIVSMYLNRLGSFLTMLFISALITMSNNVFGALAFTDYLKDLGIFKIISFFIYYLFPRLTIMAEIGGSFLNGIKSEFNVPIEFLHYFLSTAFVLWLGSYLIKKKDF
jgi:hypothetical protein